MQTVTDPARLHQLVLQWREQGFRVAFVPTMGNLHQGHIELVNQARQRADKVVSSIFVNPMQFGQGEDLDAYPRTLDDDKNKLYDASCDLLFTPEVELLYPAGIGSQTYIEVPAISDLHCGNSRPGHFRGVATVVAKLFNLVQPDIALFGNKDYQQLAVIRAMVRDLNMPVQIVGVDTVRDDDGLAKSSRNGYLTDEQRTIAPKLKQVIDATATAIHSDGLAQREQLQQQALHSLNAYAFVPDYFEICHADTLQPAQVGDNQIVILAAAQLGKARLIDNLRLDLSK
ncbi:pantoate--beta-alanine ligase [Ferrimonas lipolytica]|uniref:Pantothenate synthetase n=1 Tax=Ferrimonas lipolytica TaxID=2724191 RepID=A0A6H1UHJ2_9GAMM|nr:pantoate--beta-alanine ligase [Ferrimonas lipolytica]QIZ77686.1 pantoate--beta-alanine ligase [Ferrimonas lipolytica]